MKFEHLIEINDRLNPLIDEISRVQLWRGLVLRAEQPMLFVPHLDQCDILQRNPDGLGLVRRLRYGQLEITDTVSFLPHLQVQYTVEPQGEIPASRLVMQIEEPEPGQLFVRFHYDDANSPATDAANEMYDQFRRSAYQESDIDTIGMIRQLVSAGKLG